MIKTVFLTIHQEHHQVLVDALCARVIYLQGIYHRQRNYPPSPTRDKKLFDIEDELNQTRHVLFIAQQETGLYPSTQLLKSLYKNEYQSIKAGRRREKQS